MKLAAKMVLQIFLLCLLHMALTGCVLQSGTPLYDTSSVLALGTKAGPANSSRIEGKWVPEKETVTIEVIGQRYRGDVWHIDGGPELRELRVQPCVQGRESGKPSAYMLGTVTKGVARSSAYRLCRHQG